MAHIVKNMTIAAIFGSCLTLGPMPQMSTRAEAESETAAARPAIESGKEAMPVGQQPPSPSRAAREEKALQDARRQQLAEREAALAAKEQELKKLNAKLDAQIKALEERKKQLDESLKQKKKTLDDKRKRMLALLKKMRPEQAGQYLGKMEEVTVISILNDLDNKMILKLMPHLNQPMVLKWIKENLNNS
jgi:flagellar motility protein MotE (MotC chaperone)